MESTGENLHLSRNNNITVDLRTGEVKTTPFELSVEQLESSTDKLTSILVNYVKTITRSDLKSDNKLNKKRKK